MAFEVSDDYSTVSGLQETFGVYEGKGLCQTRATQWNEFSNMTPGTVGGTVRGALP